MRPLLAAALLLLAVGTGQAAPRIPWDDESAFTLDQLASHGASFHLRCQNGRDLVLCDGPSVWVETNGHQGLQTGRLFAYGEWRPADVPLVP